jgi:hypothetical protein
VSPSRRDGAAPSWPRQKRPRRESVLLFTGSLIVMRRTNKAADQHAAKDRQNERERDSGCFSEMRCYAWAMKS